MRVRWRQVAIAILLMLCVVQSGHAQPWTQAADRLRDTFTNDLAQALSLVAIVVGGLILMFGDGAGKRTLAGIIAGVGMAVGAQSFFNWLFL